MPTFVLCFGLALLTLIPYRTVGSHPFVNYDDQLYVTENDHIKAGFTGNTLIWAVTSTEASNWHPVTWWSHALDYELFGMNASGHHWVSVLIHIADVILLFLLLQQATGATWKSLFVASLFAVHPLNVDSVAWIAERKNVLSTLFFLPALGAYGWYARKPGISRYLVVAAMFMLGLASKPMVITLPFVLLLLDFWPLQRILGCIGPSAVFPVEQEKIGRLVLEKLPLLALSFASAAITIAAQGVSEVPAEVLPLGVRLETALYAYGWYLWKAVWPLNLAVIYPHPGRVLAVWKPLLAAVVIIAVSLFAWKQRLRRPYLPVGWLWYLGTAVPIIGIMQVGAQVVADRYAYVPLIGIFVMIAWSLLPERESFTGSAARELPRALAAGLVVPVLVFLTSKQVEVWRDSVSLWTHALNATTNNSMAEKFLSNTLLGLGRYQESMAHLRIYASMEPLDAPAHMKVAAYYQDRGMLLDAQKEYEAAIRASAVVARYGPPGLDSQMLALTYANLGAVYSQLGNDVKAAELGKRAVQTDPEAVNQMLQQLGSAVAARPSVTGYLRLATLLHVLGDDSDAQQVLARAQTFNAAVAPQAGSSQGSNSASTQ